MKPSGIWFPISRLFDSRFNSFFRWQPRTSGQCRQSVPAASAGSAADESSPCWWDMGSNDQQRPLLLRDRDTTRYAFGMPQTESGCAPSRRLAYSRRFSPLPQESPHGWFPEAAAGAAVLPPAAPGYTPRWS